MKRIVLITSGQPSTNPRLVKEADALVDSGYFVTIVYQYVSAWATEADKSLLKEKSWRALRVGGDPTSEKKLYFKTRLIYKAALAFSKRFGIYKIFAKFAIGRCTFLLEREAKKLKADLYIAHNLAALPAAFYSSKKNNAKLGFDAEDFHRHEVFDEPSHFDVRLKAYTEDFYLRYVDYFTTSSNLIADAYSKIYPKLKPIVVNNVFELKYQPFLELNNSKLLKLLWFSQTVGKNRGLEVVIEALNIVNNPKIQLHLLGNCSKDIELYLNNLASFKITYHEPLPGNEIFKFASRFDIGLALEPGFSLNNEIALSNKIFTYLLAGLNIIASNTKAQEKFMTENPSIGQCFSIGNITELCSILTNLYDDRALLNNKKRNSYQLAQLKYNWEIESRTWLLLIAKKLD